MYQLMSCVRNVAIKAAHTYLQIVTLVTVATLVTVVTLVSVMAWAAVLDWQVQHWRAIQLRLVVPGSLCGENVFTNGTGV